MRPRQPLSTLHPKPEREAEWHEEFHPTARACLSATVLVGAVYTYFLIFAQFGFLHALTAALGENHDWLKGILTAMAAAGIGGSFLAARLFSETRGRHLLTTGLVLAGLAAVVTWEASAPVVFVAAAVLAGGGTGVATVTLASMLRREIGGTRLGLCVGVATGVAYGLCNLPPVFAGEVRTQLLVAIAAVCAGLVAVQGFEQRAPRAPAEGGADYTGSGCRRWIGIFLLLVATDSAVFYFVQHMPDLKQVTWTTGAQLLLNAGAHVVAAVVAGWALDRRRVVRTTQVAAVVLAGSGAALVGGWAGAASAAFYSAAVSVYSTVLVFYPARRGDPALAAVFYAVAGWLGSGAGIVTAEQLGRIPLWLPVATGVAVVVLLASRPAQMNKD